MKKKDLDKQHWFTYRKHHTYNYIFSPKLTHQRWPVTGIAMTRETIAEQIGHPSHEILIDCYD